MMAISRCYSFVVLDSFRMPTNLSLPDSEALEETLSFMITIITYAFAFDIIDFFS